MTEALAHHLDRHAGPEHHRRRSVASIMQPDRRHPRPSDRLSPPPRHRLRVRGYAESVDEHEPVVLPRHPGEEPLLGLEPTLGATKTKGAGGVHFLAPASIGHLRVRRDCQDEERRRSIGEWPTHTYDGEQLSMVFTTAGGALANRQAVLKTIERAAKSAGIDPTCLGTHSGRRTVITALYADGGVDLADIARHVGHIDTATTAEYVRSLGNRPIDTARRAADLLDPTVGPDSS